ncbi:helix-turn-helix transcriptional regulator [Deinococcus cellulosilyticus]|uniref:HTH cro/C1-type domain-containing protein n=1 Tax=Deinococcus cellulosilyticus (strain DSM 18568 / NBRC 106333 / KACC 11606 / 5516J-15) TaxID=1223518 RepID=A0A511MW62_DEIC1|nr:hypothetical protein DC3_04250 [Deinococcus cellulosilyticus NBRC 106333 = KACC 11606]
MQLGDRIQRKLDELGWSAVTLAERSGLSRATVYALLGNTRGKRISLETATKLKEALGANFFEDGCLQKDTGELISNA